MSHLLIHGILHLKGYTHENKNNERIMQIEEIRILKNLNINNPYKNQKVSMKYIIRKLKEYFKFQPKSYELVEGLKANNSLIK